MRATLADTLRAVVKARGLSGYAVATLADVSPSVVNRFLKSERGLTLESFDRICSALGLSLVEDRRTRTRRIGHRG